jgi:hypothetical protein
VKPASVQIGLALRFVSLALIVIALTLLGADMVSSLQRGGQIAVHSIEQVWGFFGPSSIAGAKAWVSRALPPPLPDWFYSVLALPAWALTGVLGVVIAFLFGRREPEAN